MKLTKTAAVRRWKDRATQWFLERVLGAPPDVTVFLGGRPRQWAPYVRIESRALWAAESRANKARALLRGRWQPGEPLIQADAWVSYRRLYFGGDEDGGDHLAILNDWHFAREWDLDALTEKDRERADALATFTVLTHLRYKHVASSRLNLRLAERVPYMADLVYPMVAKTPVFSLRYFLDLHAHYAFNAVRRAQHPHADDVIALLYDLLFLQQKTAIALLEYTRLMSHAELHKGAAQITNAEVEAIMAADGLFAYLKASVEKTIALVGATHGIRNLDAKKEHKKRVAALREGLPKGVENLPYGAFLFEMVGTEHLEDLNDYRTGLLHKKGIADLQPHAYVARDAMESPFRKVFGVLHEQHSKNTALLLVALALLTDKLVQLDRPPFGPEDIPSALKTAELPKRFAAQEAAATQAIAHAEAAAPGAAPGALFAKRAQVRRLLGRDRDALADLQEALARGAAPEADLRYELGISFMNVDDVGNDAAAVEAFTRVIALAPGMERAYLARALAYENLGDLAAAATDLDVVIARVARPAVLLEKRGLWRLRLGRPADALADFDAAAALDHAPLDVLTGRGAALHALGDVDRALAVFDSAIEHHPRAVVVRINRAHARLDAGDHDGATADLDWVVEHGAAPPKLPGALMLRSALRDQAGDREGALADTERVAGLLGANMPANLTTYLEQLRGVARSEVTHDAGR